MNPGELAPQVGRGAARAVQRAADDIGRELYGVLPVLPVYRLLDLQRLFLHDQLHFVSNALAVRAAALQRRAEGLTPRPCFWRP